MRVFFCILTLFSLLSCKKEEQQLPPVEKTVTLLGRWKEFRPKAVKLDSNGNIIDSIDINATYEFRADFTYFTQNDIWTDGPGGTWTYDSGYPKVILSPSVLDTNSSSGHWWRINDLTEDSLKVEHTYTLGPPSQHIGVLLFRKFYKLY